MSDIILYPTLIFMTFIGSVASLFLKRASSKGNIINMLKNNNIYIGGVLYILSAVLNIFVLKYMDYSIVLPLTSITYIWTIAISYMVLKEKITNMKVIGMIFVLFGAFLIVR